MLHIERQLLFHYSTRKIKTFSKHFKFMRPSKVHVYISVLKLMLRVFDVKCKGYPVKNQMNISTPIKQEGSGDDEMLIMYYEI